MNRKIIGIIAVLLFAFCFVGAVSASSNGLVNGYGIDGTTINAGSQTNPYAINDLADFQAISSSNWGSDKYYQQTADIEYVSNYQCNVGFLGIYDGNGYTIDAKNYNFNWRINGGIIMNTRFINLKTTSVYSWYFIEQFSSTNLLSVKNCIFDGVTGSSGGKGILGGGGSNIQFENCIAFNVGFTGSDISGPRGTAVFAGCGATAGNAWYNALLKNMVAIDCSVSGGSRGAVLIGDWGVTIQNAYATNGGTSSSSPNGQSITSSQYNSKSWWENTALYDFSSSGAWEWDSVNQLPKLKHVISSTPIVTAVAVTSTTPAEIGSTVSVTATLENTPTTDAGTVTFYTSTTPAILSSWVSVGSQQISAQSTAGIISHSFTGSSTDGTYYLKAILSDTTQSITYDSYSDGSITNVFFVLQYADPIPNTPGGPLQPIGIPYTITLTASCSNEITVASYVWQLQTGSNWGNVSTGQQYTPSITTPGNHVYRFLAIGKNGHVIPSTSITVNAGYAPSAVITQPTTGTQIEPGQQLTLEATIGGTAGTYTWDFGNDVSSHGTDTGTVDSQSQSITSYVVYNQQKGTRDITLTVSNVYGTAAVYKIYIENGKGTLRPAAVSTIKPVDSSGIYNLINDSKPTSYENQMPNLSAMVTDVTAPMTSIIGEWFYLVLFAVPYIILFLRQKNILIPSILGVLFAAWLLVFLPGAAMKAAIGILILCVAGGIIGLYVKRQS